LTLSKLLAGKYAVMNFIPLNEVSGSPYRRPDPTRGVELVRQLRDHGVLATLRQSAGQDVEGGCGQLRARSLQRNSPDTSVVQFAKVGRLD
jgi:23S rRNA (adenine2503-C2)-methyltransferase